MGRRRFPYGTLVFLILLLQAVCSAQNTGSEPVIRAVVAAVPRPDSSKRKIGNIVLVFANGQRKKVTSDGVNGRPIIARDRHTVAWQQFEYIHYRDEPFAAYSKIVLWQNGRVLHSINAGGYRVDVKFYKRDTQLAASMSGAHGPSHFILYDVASGKELESFDGLQNVQRPAWAAGLSDAYGSGYTKE